MENVWLMVVIICGIVFLGLVLYGTGYAQESISGKQQYKDITNPKYINVLSEQHSMDVFCSNGQDDLRKCTKFRYLVKMDFMLKYNKPVMLAASFSFKGSNKFISYKYDGKDYTNTKISLEKEQGIFIETDIVSIDPPFLNFSTKKEYVGPVWDGQTIHVGDFSIYASIPSDAWANILKSKPFFVVMCKDEIVKAQINEVSQSLCKGSVLFTLIDSNNIASLSSDERQMYNDFGCTLDGIDFVKKNICCMKIQVTPADAEKQWKGMGESAVVTFWDVCNDDNSDGIISEDECNYDMFVKKCSGLASQTKLKYCTDRLRGEHNFFIPVKEAVAKSVPKGC